jgi:hypothetical protein
MSSSKGLDSVNGQLGKEFRFAKSVLGGMIEKSAIEPTIQGLAGHFFKEEQTGGFEDAPNFGHAGLPIHHMMQHSEVEDGVEVFIGKRKFVDTPHRQNNAALKFACESLPRAANLQRVEVESMDLACAKLLQQYLHSNTPAAPDIEYAPTVKPAAQLSQQWPLVAALHQTPCWIVDE